jgi:hypothetical protein
MRFGQTKIIKCNTGFTTSSGLAFPVTCMEGGQLGSPSGSVPTACQPTPCGTAPPLPYTETSPDAAHQFVFGETARWTCQGGLPEISMSCGARGWSPVPTCQTSCGNPQSPANGRRGGDGHIFHPQVAQLTCNDGYTHLASGAFSAESSALHQQCLPTGVFEPLGSEVSTDGNGRIVCVPVKCSRPASPSNWHWTNPNGDFSTTVPASLECDAGFSSNGMPHASTVQSVICNGDGSQSALPTPCVPVTQLISGQVRNAVNGRMVSGVTVRVTDGSGQTRETVTSDWGTWSMDNCRRGAVTVEFHRIEYSNGVIALDVQEDVDHNMALSPELPSDSGNSWRVVLSWTGPNGHQDPRDLDGHVTRHAGSDGLTLNQPGTTRSHLYWRNTWMRTVGDSSKPNGQLDRDNWSGNGDPETITFSQMMNCVSDCKFVYRVWDWCSCTESGMVDNSGAQVQLYNSDGVHSTYNIGQQGSLHRQNYEQRWDVFSLDVSNGVVDVRDCSDGGCPADNSAASLNYCGCSWMR